MLVGRYAGLLEEEEEDDGGAKLPEEREDTPELLLLPLLVREGWDLTGSGWWRWDGEDRGGAAGWCMGCIPVLIMGWDTWEAGR